MAERLNITIDYCSTTMTTTMNIVTTANIIGDVRS